jgi:hypothetical protein
VTRGASDPAASAQPVILKARLQRSASSPSLSLETVVVKGIKFDQTAVSGTVCYSVSDFRSKDPGDPLRALEMSWTGIAPGAGLPRCQGHPWGPVWSPHRLGLSAGLVSDAAEEMMWIPTFTLFVLRPGVENPAAAQAGIDSSFGEVKRPTPLFGARHDCVHRKKRARAMCLSCRSFSLFTFACACVSSTEAGRAAGCRGASPRSEDRFKKVRGQKADYGDCYPVADQVIGLVVTSG